MSCSTLCHADAPRNWVASFSGPGRRHPPLNHLFYSLSYPTPTQVHDRKTLSLKILSVLDYYCYYPLPSVSESKDHAPTHDTSSLEEEEFGEDEDEDAKIKQKEAREAVSEILQENGISKDDSIEIAIKSPRYLEMLMDGVRDLDDFQSATSPSSSSSHYKHKVYEMGKQRGDKGLLPLLESMVKYLKKILFSDNDGKVPIGRSGRRMMTLLSVPIDDDLQQTLSFLEKIQARRGGLDMLSSGDAAFRYLIESFPRLLSLSAEYHLKPLVDFLEYTGVPKGCISNILLLFPPILFYDVDKDIKQRMKVFSKVYGKDKEFGRMLLKYPWVLSTRIQENYEDILAFFSQEKVTKVSIYGAIKSWPLLLGSSVGKLKFMLNLIRDLGVAEKMLGQVIATSPQLLMQKPQNLFQVVSFLKTVGLEDEDIGEIFGRCPEIFMASVEKTLNEKVEFLSEIGVSMNHLPRAIRKYPEFFMCSVDKALLPRITYLLKMGFSERECASMVGRFSPLLGYSIEGVLRPKFEFLCTIGKPLKEVVDYPRYFSYSLKKKIKPRYLAMKSKNCECSLEEMLGKNDEEFVAYLLKLCNESR